MSDEILADDARPTAGGSPCCRRMRWAVPAFAALVTVVQMGPDWLEAYSPGIDESWMLQAGTRMAQGDGLTTSLLDDWTDLANPKYAHLQFWPPFHALLFAGLLKLGLGTAGAEAGLTVIKAAAAFAGICGWLRLGGRVLSPAALPWFALGTAGVFFASGFKAGCPHLFFWAIMPWFLAALLDGVGPAGGPRSLWIAGALAAASVGFRYHAAYLIPGAGLVVLMFSEGTLLRRAGRAVAVCILPTATLGGILLFNKFSQGASSWVAELPAQWNIDNVLRRQGLTFFFAFGFGLEETVGKLRPSLTDLPFAVYLPWYGLMAAAAAAAVRAVRRRLSIEQVRLAATVAVMAVGLVGMLAAISYRAEGLKGWVPIGDGRLYSELLPAVALVWIILVASWWTWDVRKTVRLFVLTLACAAAALEFRFVGRAVRLGVRRTTAALRDGPYAEPALAAEIRRLVRAAPVGKHRVFDAYNSCVNALRADDIRSDRFFPLARLGTCGTTEPVYVLIVVRRKTSPGGDSIDTWWADAYGEPYTEFFGLQPVGQVVDGVETCEIRAGVVLPFRPGDRPLPKLNP